MACYAYLMPYTVTQYIYNPCTRQYKELPKSRQLFDDQEVLFGFGFHPVTNEYKVVKIVHSWNWYSNYHSRFRFRNHTKSEVQVFSLSSSSGWRSIGKVPFRLKRRSSEASVNGRLHWLTEISDQGVGGSRRIISFDLADEQFREVPRPDCGGLNQAAYHLAVLGVCLSAVVYCHYEKLEIWVMKEYGVKESWVKEFDMEDRSLQFTKQESQEPSGIWKHIFGRRIAQVLCSLENGNILIEYRGGVLVSHDPITGTFKKLVFEGVPDLLRAVVHFGSLNWIDTPIHTSPN